jgi:hypothetical protein
MIILVFNKKDEIFSEKKFLNLPSYHRRSTRRHGSELGQFENEQVNRVEVTTAPQVASYWLYIKVCYSFIDINCCRSEHVF